MKLCHQPRGCETRWDGDTETTPVRGDAESDQPHRVDIERFRPRYTYTEMPRSLNLRRDRGIKKIRNKTPSEKRHREIVSL